MSYIKSLKKQVLPIFFLILSYLLAIKLLGSELYFVAKLVIGSIVICLILIVTLIVLAAEKDLKKFAKKLFLFVFLSLSLFMLIYGSDPNIISLYLEKPTTAGVVLFLVYMAFFSIFELNLSINSFVSFISLLLIPAFALGNITYSAETFAVFGFLTLIVSAILFIKQLRQHYEIA